MARRQDQLVDAIRRQRRQLSQDLQEILALEPMKAQIRERPGPWLLGSVLVGVLTARFVAAPLWRQRGSMVRQWARSRLRDMVLGLVKAGVRQSTQVSTPATPNEADLDARQLLAGRSPRTGRLHSAAMSAESG